MITSRHRLNGQAIEPFVAFSSTISKRISAQKCLSNAVQTQSLFLNAISSY